jgi:hypothetical protein
MTNHFILLGDIVLTIKNYGSQIKDEINKCLILTVFMGMGLNVDKHFDIMRMAGYESKEQYEKSKKKLDYNGNQIKMHDSLLSLLTLNSMLDVSVFQRIEWNSDWVKFMMVVLSSELNDKASEVNIYYHYNQGDQIPVSEKKVIFLHLNNLHYQGAANRGEAPITVVDLLLILKKVKDKGGTLVSQYNCAKKGESGLLPLLATLNEKQDLSDLKGLIDTVEVENLSDVIELSLPKRKVTVLLF